MDQQDAVNLISRMLVVTTELLAPILVVAIVLGVIVSIVQAATQVQEMTLTFAPKLAGVAIVLVVLGQWMIGQLVKYTNELFALIPTLIR